MIRIKNIVPRNNETLYAVVNADWFSKYGYNAFVENQAIVNTIEEAREIKAKFQLVDGIEYTIIKIRGGKNEPNN